MRISARKGVKFYQNGAISLLVEAARRPDTLVVPLSVVKGERLTLAVQPGSRVHKYQALALPEGDGSPVYAPGSGRFEQIVERRIPGLGKTPCALLRLDGEEHDVSPKTRRRGRFTPEGGAQILEGRGPVRGELSLRRLIGIAKRAAIVDERDGQRLWRKLEALEDGPPPFAVYVDAIDDQPFMSASLAILASFGEDIREALRLLCGALNASGGILARWNREADALLGEAFMEYPVTYVQGKYPSAPVVDVYVETIQGVRFGAGACLALARAVAEGLPQTTAVVTVAGDGVQTPLNLEVPLGTSVEDLLTQCGASGVIQRVVAGGLMSGRIIGPAAPLLPSLTALTAQSATTEPPRTACTGCGRCASVCPAGLAPFYLYQAAKGTGLEGLRKLGGADCIECGCCSYVCPAGLPLSAGTRWIRRNLEALEQRRRAALENQQSNASAKEGRDTEQDQMQAEGKEAAHHGQAQ